MKQRPILFSAPMVQAILAGRKTMTRRVINKLKGYSRITEFGLSDTPNYDWHFRDKHGRWVDMDHAQLLALCPYGQVGERLWVRESFAGVYGHEVPIGHPKKLCGTWGVPAYPEFEACVVYKADGAFNKLLDPNRPYSGDFYPKPCYESALFMPRDYSRILLEITDIRIERLQDISETDAIAEGCCEVACGPDYTLYKKWAFRELWNSINGADSWDENPWVWVIEFKVVQGGDL